MNGKKAKQIRRAVIASRATWAYDRMANMTREAREIYMRRGFRLRWHLVAQLGDYVTKVVGKRVFQLFSPSGEMTPRVMDSSQTRLEPGSAKSAYRSAKRAFRAGGMNEAYGSLSRTA